MRRKRKKGRASKTKALWQSLLELPSVLFGRRRSRMNTATSSNGRFGRPPRRTRRGALSKLCSCVCAFLAIAVLLLLLLHRLGGESDTEVVGSPLHPDGAKGPSFYERESAALLRGADVAANAARSAVGAVVMRSRGGGDSVHAQQMRAPGFRVAGGNTLGDAPGTGNIRTITVVLPCAGEGNLMAQTARSIYEATPADVLQEIVGHPSLPPAKRPSSIYFYVSTLTAATPRTPAATKPFRL